MRHTKLLVDPFMYYELEQLNIIANLDIFNKLYEPVNLKSLFYSYMLQNGIDGFEVFLKEKDNLGKDNLGFKNTFKSMKEPLYKSQFLSKRVYPLNSKEWIESCAKVFYYFKNRLGEDCFINEKNKGLLQLSHFLINLLYSVKNNTCFTNLAPIPNVESFEGKFPADIYFPIKSLVQNLITVKTEVPYLTKIIDSKSIKIFDELMRSDLFNQYTSAHGKLDKLYPFRKDNAQDKIKSLARKIYLNHEQLTKIKSVSIKILPISAKIIDTVFGKFSGLILEIVSKSLDEILNNKRQIVFYEYDPFLHEYIGKRVKQYYDNNIIKQ